VSSASNPQRTCIGCKTKRPQSSLLRVVVASDGEVIFSRVATGRGAWLCNPPEACLELAEKRRGFDRALRRPLGKDALTNLSTTPPAAAAADKTTAAATTTAGAAGDDETKG